MEVVIMDEEETATAIAHSLLRYLKEPAHAYTPRAMSVHGYFSGLNRDMKRKYVSAVRSFGNIILLGNGGFMLDPRQFGEASLKSAFKLSKSKALYFARIAAGHKTIIKPSTTIDAAGVCMIGSVFSRFETLKNIEEVSS